MSQQMMMNIVKKGSGQVPEPEPILSFNLWDESLGLPDIYINGDALPNPTIVEGANNLADALEESSEKIRPTIIVEEGQTIPERSIRLGYPYPNAKSNEEEIFIKAENNILYLSGTEEFDPNNSTWLAERPGVDNDEPDYSTKAGTYHAVNVFLNEYVGVVQPAPSELFRVVPTHTVLTLEEHEKRHVASTEFRTPVRFNKPADNRSIGKDFQKFNNGFYGQHIGVGGHQLKNVLERTHPEAVNPLDYVVDGILDETAYQAEKDDREQYRKFFAFQANFERTGWPYDEITVDVPTASGTQSITYRGGRKTKYETGDPDYPQFWIEQVADKEILLQPLQDSLPEGVTDGWGQGHSLDTRNIDYDEPDAYTLSLQTQGSDGNGVASIRPALTDRMLWYCQLLKQKADNEYTKDYRISIGAYGPILTEPRDTYPKEFLEKLIVRGIFNEFANPNYISRAFPQFTFKQMFDAWLDYLEDNNIENKVIVWRPNVGDSYGHSLGLYFNHIGVIVPRFKELIGRGVNGLMPDTLWGHYSTQWVLYYALTSLCWDSNKNVNDLLDDAYDKLFGNASADIKTYYDLTESQITNNIQHKITLEQLINLWSPIITDLENAITSAKSKLTVGTKQYDRVLWVEAGLQWSKDIIQASEYFLELQFGAVITGGNVATNNNAIEKDINGNEGQFNTNGWTVNGATIGVFEAQSVVTSSDNSNSAFRITSTGGSSVSLIRDTPFPGDSNDTYIVSLFVYVSVSEEGSAGETAVQFQEIDSNGNSVQNFDRVFSNEEEFWTRQTFIVSGGNRLKMRDASGLDRPAFEAYIDNLEIIEGRVFTQQEIDDKTEIWETHNDEAIARIQPERWDGVSPESVVSTPCVAPIGRSAEARIPAPGSLDLGGDTGDLE